MPPLPIVEKEKRALLPTSTPTSVSEATPKHTPKTSGRAVHICLCVLTALVCFAVFVPAPKHPRGCSRLWRIISDNNDDFDLDAEGLMNVAGNSGICKQPPALLPTNDLWTTLVAQPNGTYSSDGFIERAVNWLSGAVRLRTEMFDKMAPVGVDPRWEVFGPFQEYLLTAFPLIHSTLKLTKVNTYGLVYVWEGGDASLKPLLLAAHQDVVPVNPDTLDAWMYPPFSGHFDGKRVWGRGSSDDKAGLVGIMATIETLLEHSFQPRRTVILAFGFDEEASGPYGASAIAQYLLQAYGQKSFSMLVDEGGDYMDEYGVAVATVGTAEKGYIDTRVEVTAPGGHSSVPPTHTTIGILAALLVHIESTPYTPHLARGTPMYAKALCLAAHAPAVPSHLRRSLLRAARAPSDSHDKKADQALKEAEDILFADPRWRALAGTTQAIDLIQGGVKTNALPERAWAVVNHRIATDGSLEEVQKHATEALVDLAEKFDLNYTAFGEVVREGNGKGKVNVEEAWGAALKPAPITPSEGDKAGPWKVLAGTARATYGVHRATNSSEIQGEGEKLVVSPGIMSGNTDTRYYWGLTEHIFRYNHHYTGDHSWLGEGVHTVDESIAVDAWIEMIRFFTTLILNVDEASL